MEQNDIKVEIIFPQFYIERSLKTMSRYAGAIAHLCKGAAMLGEDETEFLIFGMTVMQVTTAEEAMEKFGVKMTHDNGWTSNGKRWTYFYADVRELKKRMGLEEL